MLVPYDQFVAPGLMAAAAMNGAIFECTANVFFKIKHSKLYDAVLATPMSAGDVAFGEISGAVVRSAVYSVAFALTMWALGMVESPWFVLAIPAATLIGLTFASLGMALTTFMRSWEDFEYVPAITLPLFLFSTTFYPISQYGEWSWVVGFSPLYHGVELVRAANLGQWDPSIIGHVAVLVGLSLVGRDGGLAPHRTAPADLTRRPVLLPRDHRRHGVARHLLGGVGGDRSRAPRLHRDPERLTRLRCRVA